MLTLAVRDISLRCNVQGMIHYLSFETVLVENTVVLLVQETIAQSQGIKELCFFRNMAFTSRYE